MPGYNDPTQTSLDSVRSAVATIARELINESWVFAYDLTNGQWMFPTYVYV